MRSGIRRGMYLLVLWGCCTILNLLYSWGFLGKLLLLYICLPVEKVPACPWYNLRLWWYNNALNRVQIICDVYCIYSYMLPFRIWHLIIYLYGAIPKSILMFKLNTPEALHISSNTVSSKYFPHTCRFSSQLPRRPPSWSSPVWPEWLEGSRSHVHAN